MAKKKLQLLFLTSRWLEIISIVPTYKTLNKSNDNVKRILETIEQIQTKSILNHGM